MNKKTYLLFHLITSRSLCQIKQRDQTAQVIKHQLLSLVIAICKETMTRVRVELFFVYDDNETATKSKRIVERPIILNS